MIVSDAPDDVGEAGELAAGVAGRDPVAVGVLDVVERAVGVEGLDLAVGLLEGERAARALGEDAVVARLVEVIAAAAVGLEDALSPEGMVTVTVPSEATLSEYCQSSVQP